MIAEIKLENIRIYAYHGCLKEERTIGSWYRVDIIAYNNILKASLTDKLEDTADYVRILQVIKDEMAIAANLLEHVIIRTKKAIFNELISVEKLDLRISKLNPPINGDVESVSLRIIAEREN